ncbi:unnamed protein product [Ilex paraguariensis]|uniref:Uncharacterized protein n=1 Tax=Ilex paraguariensis TaxID=185542 RepID=A0ABC8QVJ1_9AQUA
MMFQGIFAQNFISFPSSLVQRRLPSALVLRKRGSLSLPLCSLYTRLRPQQHITDHPTQSNYRASIIEIEVLKIQIHSSLRINFSEDSNIRSSRLRLIGHNRSSSFSLISGVRSSVLGELVGLVLVKFCFHIHQRISSDQSGFL